MRRVLNKPSKSYLDGDTAVQAYLFEWARRVAGWVGDRVNGDRKTFDVYRGSRVEVGVSHKVSPGGAPKSKPRRHHPGAGKQGRVEVRVRF